MNIDSIDPNDQAFTPWKENFILPSAECRCKNMEEAYNRDIELRDAYEGRELLEMMQNADDQNSSTLEISLDSSARILTIANYGKDTIPFSKAGFECLIRSNTSNKNVRGNSAIGNKGCGFRSLLNWAEEIKVHSNGVVFTFSESARAEAWRTICYRTNDEFERGKADLICRLSQKYGDVRIPLSIMATPTCTAEQVEDGTSRSDEKGWITTITIKYYPNRQGEIKKQLEAITPESLLFVRHLTVVKIRVDGAERDISCERISDFLSIDNFPHITISELKLTDRGKATKWITGKKTIAGNEIAVAWRADRHPITSARVAYTYFPTTFQLAWLPCILHATFALDPSRNGINNSNDNRILMRDCGKFLADIAAGIANNTKWSDPELSDDQVWFPFDILNMGSVAENDELHRALQEGIQQGCQDSGAVFPVTSHHYVKREQFACYSSKLASYLVEKNVTDSFQNHIWRSFDNKARGINPKYDHDNVCRNAEALMKAVLTETKSRAAHQPGQKIDFGDYIKALEIIIDIKNKNQSAYFMQVACLPDLNADIIPQDETGYINCGERLEGADACLGIHYVNRDFVDCYQLTGLISDWDNGRGLARRLNGICKCSSSDINPMKERLVIRSRSGYPDARGNGHGPETCFHDVVKCLYDLYNRNPQINPISLYLHVLCEDGRVRQACDVCLWDETGIVGISSLFPNLEIPSGWRMKGSLQYWQAELNANDQESRCRVIDFFCDFIGISLGFPCKVQYCSRWDDGQYIAHQCEIADAYFSIKPHHFNEWDYTENFHLSGEYEANSLYGLDSDFIDELRNSGLSGADIFECILRDKILCGRITYKPIVYAKFHGPKNCSLSQSYLSYSMRTLRWVRELSNDEMENRIQNWDIGSRQRARGVMSLLGVSRELEDLPIEEIYERLRLRRDPAGIQGFYSRARMAIRKCIDQGTAREDQCLNFAKEKLTELFARVWNEEKKKNELRLVRREDIRYWDNALVSRSLLNTLPKLEIGTRVGAASVEKYFGVRQLKPDDVVIMETVRENVDKNLSAGANVRLRNLRKYILAARLCDEWLEDVRSAAGKCKTFNILVVRPTEKAFYLRSDDDAGNERRYPLKNEGDLLQDVQNGVYYICSSSSNIEDLWGKSSFRSSVVEALCIHFQLTGAQIESAFREVLRNNESENEELRTQIVSEEQWETLLSALGIPDDEHSFWRVLVRKSGRKLSDGDINAMSFENGNWKVVLTQWFGLEAIPDEFSGIGDFPKMTDVEIIRIMRWAKIKPSESPELIKTRIIKFVEQEAQKWTRFRAKGAFASKLHENLVVGSSEDKKRYVGILHDFIDLNLDQVSEAFISQAEFPGDVDKCLDEILSKLVKEKFSIDMTGWPEWGEQSEPLPCTKLVEKYVDFNNLFNSLPYEMQSLAFFEGYDELLTEEFDNRSRKLNGTEDDEQAEAAATGYIEERELCAEDLRDMSADNSVPSLHSHSGGTNYNDALKRAKGETAENIVEQMLKSWKEHGKCLRFGAYSTISNVLGTAKDDAHFDFWYETPQKEIRLMEVKSFSGSRIIMSKGEFDSADSSDWRDKYDLVLVRGRQPLIMKGPLFGSDSKYEKVICKEVASYKLKIELADADEFANNRSEFNAVASGAAEALTPNAE